MVGDGFFHGFINCNKSTEKRRHPIFGVPLNFRNAADLASCWSGPSWCHVLNGDCGYLIAVNRRVWDIVYVGPSEFVFGKMLQAGYDRLRCMGGHFGPCFGAADRAV